MHDLFAAFHVAQVLRQKLPPTRERKGRALYRVQKSKQKSEQKILRENPPPRITRDNRHAKKARNMRLYGSRTKLTRCLAVVRGKSIINNSLGTFD